MDELEDFRRRSRMAVKLIFDTADYPRSVAAAGEAPTSRHLLYEVDRLCLDLRLDCAAPASERLLVGQLTDRCDPLRPMTDVPVYLTSGNKVLASTSSNRRGEFQMSYEPRDALALFLSLGKDRLIEVPVIS